MKTLIQVVFFAAFLFPCRHSFTQSELTLNADYRTRPSLQSIKGGGGLCFLKGKKKNAVFTIVNEDLKPIVEHEIEMPSDMTLAQCVFNGEYYMAEFRLFRSSFAVNKLYFFVFDKTGKLVFENRLEKQRESDIHCDRRLYPAENGNFIMTENGRDKKTGIIAYRINYKMDVLWESFFTFEENHLILTDFDYYANRLVFTGRRSKLNEKKSHRNDLFIADGQTGETIAQIPLFTNEKIMMPSAPLIESDGSVVISGSYFNSGKKISFDNSDGIFLNKFDSTGEVMFQKNQPWGSISGLRELRKNLNVTKMGEAKIQTYTVSRSGDKYLILGEFFGKTLTGTSIIAGTLENEPWTGLSLMDFVVLNLTKARMRFKACFPYRKNLNLLTTKPS